MASENNSAVDSSVLDQGQCSQSILNKMIDSLIQDKKELKEENGKLKKEIGNLNFLMTEMNRRIVAQEKDLAELGRTVDELKENSKYKKGTFLYLHLLLFSDSIKS